MQVRATYRELFPTLTDRTLVPVYYLGMILVVYALVTPILYKPHVFGDRYILVYLTLGAITFGGLRVTYAAGTRAYSILMRSIICFALFYIVTSHVTIADELVAGKSLADFELNMGWLVAIACGIVGLFRPSFGLVPILYTFWQKHQLTYVFTLHVDWMDYFTLIETGTVLILGYLVFAIFQKFFGLDILTWKRAGVDDDTESKTIHPVDMLVILAVALHFGNYFYAGLIKAVLGENPADWFLNNQTHILMLAALESAVLPISFSKGLTAFAHSTIESIQLVTNFATILIQLLAVAAIVRIRWAIIITLCYDVLHLTIFVLTGIFFWKFIVLNLAIVAALATIHVKSLPRALKYVFCATVVMSQFFFQIMPSYAWLDSPSMNSIRLIAITDDGSEYRVPSNYFYGMSITFAQHRMVWPENGPLPTKTWGTTRKQELKERGLACSWGYENGQLPEATYTMTKEHISEFVRRYHRQVMFMVNDNGYFNYDLFPHHIFSVPWQFENFKALDKRRITKYRYESEAICLGFEDGALKRDRMWSDSFDIPVR